MADLCILSDVKAWLNIGSASTEDSLISRLITSMSVDFMNEIKRPDIYPSADYTETREGDGGNSMVLRHWPLTAITSITVNGVTVSSGNYYIDMDLDPERRWEVFLTDASGLVFTDTQAVVIAYAAGYAAVPDDIDQAVIEWVAQRYKARQAIGQTSVHVMQGESLQTPEIDIPQTVQRVIERYRRFDPLQIPLERTPAIDQGRQPASRSRWNR
jgi:uncharacterized phiE125 gp8 family phage protein